MQMWIASWEASFARIVGADLVVKPFMIGQFINDTGLLFESYPVEDWEGPRKLISEQATPGIEPGSPAWRAEKIPLGHARFQSEERIWNPFSTALSYSIDTSFLHENA